MTNLINKNETLNKITNVLAKAKDDRASIVNEVITLIIEEGKNQAEYFTTKKQAQKYIIEYMLEDINKDEVNGYTKRALYVAKAILIDGVKIKKEFLSLAQAEKLVRCDKALVNRAMSIESEEDYIYEAKTIIKAREEFRARDFLSEQNAMEIFDTLKTTFGDDTKKVLNAMIKTL